MMTTSLILAATWTALGVYPYSLDKRLPDERPADGREITRLELAAAKGEYETASFVLKADAAVAKFGVKATDLKGPDGRTLPADAVDVKVVKVWFQPRDAWLTERVYGLANGDFRLTPNMLLHDDSLIRVDETNKVNFLRVDYADGSRYLDMMRRGRLSKFNYDLQPVKDAPAFVPCALEAGRFKQFWITVKVPRDAAPGDYAGRLSFSVDGRPSGGLDMKLAVYPFALPGPRTHYDSSRKYFVALMHGPSLGEMVEGSGDVAASERKLRAMCRSLVAHNVLNPFGPGDAQADTSDDFAARSLAIWRQEGLPCDVLFGGRAYAFIQDGFVGFKEKDPEGYAAAFASFRNYIDLQLAVTERWLGHRRRAFYGFDEASTQANRRQYESWRYIRSQGGEVFVTSPIARDVGWMVDWADVPASCSKAGTEDWHAAGARVLNYAAPFAGATAPEIWRRTQGIRYWFADYDGLADLAWWSGDNRWNDNTWRKSEYQQMGMVYPTVDGVIDTLAYDALREAIDDIRYLTLHRLLAEKAGDRAELDWIESVEPEDVADLDAFRAEVARRCVALQAKTGPLPDEPSAAKAPDLPPYAGPVKAHPEDVDWLVGHLRRPEALKILDGKLAQAGLSNGEKASLLLKRHEVMLTDMVFEEVFSAADLEAAARTMNAAFAVPGVQLDRRVAAIERMADACNRSGQPGLAMKYVEDFLAAAKALDGGRRSRLEIVAAEAAEQLRQHRKVISLLKAAELHDPTYLPKARVYALLSDAAEASGDWKEAQRALFELRKTISKHDYPTEYANCERRLVEVGKKISSASAPIAPEEGETLDLDE